MGIGQRAAMETAVAAGGGVTREGVEACWEAPVAMAVTVAAVRVSIECIIQFLSFLIFFPLFERFILDYISVGLFVFCM
jgi:hypothetical protein